MGCYNMKIVGNSARISRFAGTPGNACKLVGRSVRSGLIPGRSVRKPLV